MDLTLTPLKVVNRALVEIAQGVPLASGTPGTNFDGSPNGIYAAALYQGAVEMLLRQQDYEFSRTYVPLVNATVLTPPYWQNAYVYPAQALRIRQVLPPTLPGIDDPIPVRWDVGWDGTQQVIWSNLAFTDGAIITTRNVNETQWDSMFTEQMVRYLGSQLAIPVAGRPDFSEKMLDWSGKIGGADMDRDS
jgi:hypothetical protein